MFNLLLDFEQARAQTIWFANTKAIERRRTNDEKSHSVELVSRKNLQQFECAPPRFRLTNSPVNCECTRARARAARLHPMKLRCLSSEFIVVVVVVVHVLSST